MLQWIFFIYVLQKRRIAIIIPESQVKFYSVEGGPVIIVNRDSPDFRYDVIGEIGYGTLDVAHAWLKGKSGHPDKD